MTDRYVYAVTHRLPQNQRPDIERELRGLIADMLEERVGQGEADGGQVEEVLAELGDPAVLAAKYRGRERYLIGPGLFDTYVVVLKVVAASILLGLTVAFLVQLAIQPLNILDAFIDYVTGLILGAVQGFAWVTLTFALIDRYVDPRDLKRKGGRKRWSPADLPPVPDAKLSIKLAEPIAGIFFNVVFLIWFVFAAGWFAVNVGSGDGVTVIHLFDPDVIRGYLPLILVAFAVAILREMSKLLTRRWTIKLVAWHAVSSVVLLVIGLYIFTDAAIWHAGFVTDWAKAGLIDASGEAFASLSDIWSFIQTRTPIFIAIGFVIDLAMILWKLVPMRRQAATP